MPSFTTVHRVRHLPEKMFDIVADIRAYPEFVPMCTNMRVRSETERHGQKILIADMSVGYKAINETFTSQVVLNKEEMEIRTKYLEGPFRYLHNSWKFRHCDADSAGCDIEFYIDYEFKSRALAMLMGAMFDRVFARFTRAFEERADKIYASPTD